MSIRLLRIFLIVLTALTNGMVGSLIFGLVVGVALGVINLLSVIPSIAKGGIYQGILGWTSYVMPMSWPGHAVGLFMFAINLVGSVFARYDLRIRDVRIDWKAGNIFTVGGWAGRLCSRAFNLGAFTFVNPSRCVNGKIVTTTFKHESGHMLNNAAFGLFQVTRVLERNSRNSFWEQIAESNVPRGLRNIDPLTPEPDRPRISQWG